MKLRTMNKAVFFSTLILVVMSSAQVLAQDQRSGRGRGGFGDWLIKSESQRGPRESILSLSRDQEGNVTGAWISSRSVSELQDLSFAEGKLSFTQTRRGRDGETSTSKFVGTIAGDVLTGTMTSDRGELKIEGKRMPRMPRAVGTWEMKFKRGDRDITAKLIIKADAEGELTAEWPSDRAQFTVSDLTVERRELSFKLSHKRDDQEMVSTFTGSLQQDGMTGTLKSDRGETPVTGTRVGAALIGTWNLETKSERGEGKQRLVVYPDMTGLYGSVAVKSITLEGDKVSFKVMMQRRDQQETMTFTGQLAESGLTGELVSERGRQTITGTKAPQRRGRGQRNAR